MLPTVNIPVYFANLPSTGEKVKYQPFLVKSDKMLAISAQSSDDAVILEAIKNIVRDCTFNKIDPDKVPSFDTEYLFVQARAKSKGEKVDLSFTCKNLVDGKECGCVNKMAISCNDIIVKSSDPTHTKKVMVTDSIGIEFKYPTIDKVVEIQKAVLSGKIEAIYGHIFDYVDSIFEGNAVFVPTEAENTTDPAEFTKAKFAQWIEALSPNQFAKIEKFFAGIPELQSDVNLKCTKCGYTDAVHLSGLLSFLD